MILFGIENIDRFEIGVLVMHTCTDHIDTIMLTLVDHRTVIIKGQFHPSNPRKMIHHWHRYFIWIQICRISTTTKIRWNLVKIVMFRSSIVQLKHTLSDWWSQYMNEIRWHLTSIAYSTHHYQYGLNRTHSFIDIHASAWFFIFLRCLSLSL